MKRMLLLVAVAGGLLAFTGAAQAKEIVELKICGSSGCVTSKDKSLNKAWEANGSPTQVFGAKPSAFYTVRIGFGDPEGNVIHTETAYWVTRSNVMRYGTEMFSGDAWWKLVPAQVTMLRSVASGLVPFTPRLSRARVGGKPVSDPSSYMLLFQPFRYSDVLQQVHRWVKVTMTVTGPNAWASGKVEMNYAPREHVLERENGRFRVPASLGARLMHRASLGPLPGGTVAEQGSDGSNTVLYAGIGAAGLVLAGLAAFVARRKARDS